MPSATFDAVCCMLSALLVSGRPQSDNGKSLDSAFARKGGAATAAPRDRARDRAAALAKLAALDKEFKSAALQSKEPKAGRGSVASQGPCVFAGRPAHASVDPRVRAVSPLCAPCACDAVWEGPRSS